MYRIVFDPKISRFVVQLLVWHLFWRDCYREKEAYAEPVHERITFGTYADAAKWVASTGLKEAYAEQAQRTMYRSLYPRTR